MAVGLITAFNAAAKGLVSAVGANTLKVAAAGAIFSEVGDKLAKSLKDITKVDQRLSVINTDLQKTLDGNSKALEDTTGGLVQASKALTELRILGFKDSNKNLVNLATRLKLSGQNTEALFQVSQSLLGLGGISESAIDRFAKNVTDLSLKFGVTADSIVQAVNQLSNNLLDLNILGGVESAAEFTSNLAAYVGDENAKLAGSFAKTLTSISTNQNQLNIAGLEVLANQVATGARVSFASQKQQIIEAANQVRSIVGNQGDLTVRQLQALRPIVGDVGIQAVRLADELRKGAGAQSFGDKISELIEVVKENLLAPFNSSIVQLQPSFEFLIKGLIAFGTSILNLVTAFKPVIALIFGAVGAIAGLIGAIVDGVAFVIDNLLAPFGFEATGWDKVNQSLTKILEVSEQGLAASQDMAAISRRKEARELIQKDRDISQGSYIKLKLMEDIDRLARDLQYTGQRELLKAGSDQNRILEGIERNTRTRQKPGSSK